MWPCEGSEIFMEPHFDSSVPSSTGLASVSTFLCHCWVDAALVHCWHPYLLCFHLISAHQSPSNSISYVSCQPQPCSTAPVLLFCHQSCRLAFMLCFTVHWHDSILVSATWPFHSHFKILNRRRFINLMKKKCFNLTLNLMMFFQVRWSQWSILSNHIETNIVSTKENKFQKVLKLQELNVVILVFKFYRNYLEQYV